MRVKKILKISGITLAVLLVVAQFVGPRPVNPAVRPEESVHALAAVPPNVDAVLRRACHDCHSNETRWPWYSRVAPARWLVVDHVNHGRQHMNFSTWSQRPSHASEEFDTPAMLAAICKEASTGRMPMESYLWMHRDARLSPADGRALCEWTAAEVERWAALPPR